MLTSDNDTSEPIPVQLPKPDNRLGSINPPFEIVPITHRKHVHEKPQHPNATFGIVAIKRERGQLPVAIVDRGDDGSDTFREDAIYVAKLFSAAPELLEACRKAIPEIVCLYKQSTGKDIGKAKGSVKNALLALQTAIAKATTL